MGKLGLGVAVSLLVVGAWGCGGTDGAGLITDDDAGEDAPSSVDAGADVTPIDATVDAGGEDATVDASPNDGGRKDTGADASKDAPIDAPIDAVADTSVDAPGDAPIDAPVDAADAACDAVGAPFHFHVDPVNGSDAPSSTGSGTVGGRPSSGCALKTITNALSLLPVSAPAGTQIVIDVTSDVGAGETFPIDVPANVEIRGAAGTNVRVRVPAGASGVVFATSGSALRNLALDGQGATALHGIVASDGADSTILAVDITGFRLAGVRAQGGALAIGGGATLSQNGTNGQPAPGLRVLGAAMVSITGGTIGSPTSFSQNQGPGIDVRENGSITLVGAPSVSALGAGTVVAVKNGDQGVVVQQNLVLGAPFPPASSIDGLVASTNASMGLEVLGGSALRLRNSVFLKNGVDGVRVSGNASGTAGQDYDDIARIDLGAAGASPSYGKNVLQDPSAFNQGVGLCLALVDAPASLPQTLKAAGNVFGPALDCSTTNATLTRGACAGNPKGTVGIQGSLDTMNVSMCTLN